MPVTVRVIASETSPPAGAAITISGGARTTRSPVVSLKLFASDSGSGMGEMRLSNDGVTWSQWMPYATTKAWQLATGTGTKTVRAQFRDKLRNASGVVSDSIIFDTTAPSSGPGRSADLHDLAVQDPVCHGPMVRDRRGRGVVGYDVDYRKKPATTWTNWGAS